MSHGEGRGFGHGKVILLGEHAVVFGQPALAAGLAAGVTATARPGNGRITLPAWNLQAQAGDGSRVGTAVADLLRTLGVSGLDFDLTADIPAGAGLGSSAAMAAAIARAAAGDAPQSTLRAAVDASERVFHGNPSGIDAAAALSGTVGLYQREEGWRPLVVRQPVKLLVGLSGKPRDTGAQVAAVGHLVARLPVATHVIEALGTCAKAGVAALADGDIDTLGRLFDVAHGLLGALRLSTLELDRLVHTARAAGAIGAKLTGAGGGGAVIAIGPSHRRDILERWNNEGFQGFDTVIGGAK